MKKLLLVTVLVFASVLFGYVALYPGHSATPAVAGAPAYSAKLYVSAMGGHFAVAETTIDPNDGENPIKISSLDKIDIGNKATHPTHDPRIDDQDRNKMYWSTYKLDPNGMVHVGVSDLTTGKVLKDEALKLDDRAKWTGALYCGSGQTRNSFMPVTMTDEAYIDVFDKKTLKLKHRVFLDYKPGQTKFYHGTNSPDMKKFVVAVNLADNGNMNGKIDILMLDLPSLEQGKVKVLARNQLTGEPGKTITFRQYFTNDGKFVLQSARDRMYVIDAQTLKPVKEQLVSGENHDVMPTPDGKYAVLTLRETKKDKDGKDTVDGSLQLFDMQAKKLVGKPASTCFKCHQAMGIGGSAVLCGIDGNWKK